MVLEIGEKDLQRGSLARQESLDRCTVISRHRREWMKYSTIFLDSAINSSNRW